MNPMPLLWALPGILLLQYAQAWSNTRSLGKLLPLDTPQAVQNFWNRLQARQSKAGLLRAFLIGAGLAIIPAEMAYDPGRHLARWRASGVVTLAFIFASLLAYLLPAIAFDRKIRQTTWTRRRNFAHAAGLHLLWHCPFYAMLITAEVSRQFAFGQLQEPGWPLLNYAGMALVFWNVARLLSLASRRLIGLRPLAGHPLQGTVRELCEAAGIKPPTLHLVPDRGGKIPLLAVMGRELIASEYLLRELTPAQVRAGLAHEVGHLAGGDVRRRKHTLLLLLLGGMLLLSFFPRAALERILVEMPMLYLFIPLVPLVFLPRLLLRGYRQQELQADRVGAKLLGDPALMAAALEQIHALAYLPASFPREQKMTHPSLVHRLEALRAMIKPAPIP